MTAAIRIVSPGLLTSIQDIGRIGHQRFGISVSGACDRVSLAAANVLVGNALGAAALEIAYQGPTFEVQADSMRVAFAGGTAAIDIIPADGGTPTRLAMFESRRLVRGETLRIGALSGSAVGYLAIEGGFDIAPFAGSLSTFSRAAFGGWKGRALMAGDEVPLKLQTVEEREEYKLPPIDLTPPPRIRVVLGPQDDYFTETGIRTFLNSTYSVTQASDRMGMRLDGPTIEDEKGFNIVSDGIATGSIQVPGTSLPIILLSDRQTTGGYPKIATVISADLPALGRLSPGAQICFEAVSIEQAEALRGEMIAMIDSFASRMMPITPTAIIDEGKLLTCNLISGVVNGNPLPENDISLEHDQYETAL